MKLILIRHGATKANIERRFQGTVDFPLCKEGMEQAKLLGKRLEKFNLSRIYTSDLSRALYTAREITRHYPESEPEIVPELREYSWGIIEGMTREEIRDRYKSLGEKLDQDFWAVKIPGEEGMRSLKKRISKVFDLLISRHLGLTDLQDKGEREDNIAVVSHGRIIGGFLAYITGYDLYNFPWPFVFSNASITGVKVFLYNEEIKSRIFLLNDTCHVEHIDKGITY